MDELNTYNNVASIKRMLDKIEDKKKKYLTLKTLSQKFSDDIRLKELKSSLEKSLKYLTQHSLFYR